MSRVPLQQLEPLPDELTPQLARVAESFAAEGRSAIDLHRALANAPAILMGFHELSDALRYQTSLPRALTETVILRIALLTESEYEWEHHSRMARKAGVSQAQLRDLPIWRDSSAFDDQVRSALTAADAIHGLDLDDGAFGDLRKHFSDQEIVELVVLISHYEAVARIATALRIEVEPEYRPDPGDSERVPAWQAFALRGGKG